MNSERSDDVEQGQEGQAPAEPPAPPPVPIETEDRDQDPQRARQMRSRGRIFYTFALLGVILFVATTGLFLMVLSMSPGAPAAPTLPAVVTPPPVGQLGRKELPPGVAPGLPEPPSGSTLLVDHFSDPTSGWRTGEFAGLGSARYQDGLFAFEIRSPGSLIFSTYAPAQGDIDLLISAEVAAESIDEDSLFGLMCRAQSGGEGYYFFIGPGGTFAIFKADGDGWIPLINWAYSPALLPEAQPTALRIICDGSDLSFIVNGRLVAEAQDSEFGRGMVGMFAGSYGEGRFRVEFDDLVLRQPAK